MAIDRNPNTESDKPKPGSNTDAAVTDDADASSPDTIKTFLQKLGDAAAPASATPEIKVAYNGEDLTGMLPVLEVPNLLETQPVASGDHKTGPIDSLPVDLHPVEFVQPHLSLDAIARNADLVFEALTRRTQQYRTSTPNPDFETIKNILQNMEEVDRQQLEQYFQERRGISLRQSLKTNLKPGEALATIEAILNSKNGETNLAGNAQIALTVLETDPVRGVRMLRGVLGTLNSAQANALKTKFQSDYGVSLESAIANNSSLNPAQKEVLTGLLAGVADLPIETLKTLAQKAVAAKDLGLLSSVVGDNVALRGILNSDATFQKSVLEAFGTQINRRSQTRIPNPIANDILREGRISLASILNADTGTLLHFLDNPENTDFVFTHATPKDVRDYYMGRSIVENNRQPTTAAEIEAKRVYEVLEAAIKSRAEGPRQAILREQLLFGGKFLVSDLASMVAPKYALGFLGGEYNVSDMLVHIEKNLTEAQFNKFKDSTYRDEFARSLQSFLKPEEQAKVLALIDAKLKVQNFTDSKAILRPFETFITDYKASGSTNIRQFIERLEMMTPDEATKYQTDPTFKKTLDDFADLLILTGDSKAENAIPLIKSYLNQVFQTGKPPVPNELDKLIKEWGFVQDDLFQGMSDAAIQAKKYQTIAQVEQILQNPEYMAILSSIFKRQSNREEVSREEAALTRSLDNILWQSGAGINAFNSLMVDGHNTVGIAGHMPFAGETVTDKASTYSVIARLPKDQLDNWRTNLLLDHQKPILENVLAQNGNLTLADKLRVLVTQGGKLTDLSTELGNLNEAEFTAIETEYLTKYKTELKTDLRNKIPQRERMTPEQTAMFETILKQNGKVFPIDRMRMLINGNGGKFQDYQSYFANLPAEEWTQLQSDYIQKYGIPLRDALLAAVTQNENLDRNHQILIKHILDEGNGSPQLIDKLRAFILGDGGKFSDFKQVLKELSIEQRQKLHDQYLRVFGSNLDNDFLSKVDKAFKLEYMLMLSVTPRDGLNDFFLRMSQYAPMTVADGTDLSMQRMLQINEQVVRQFNATFKDIPKPVQEALAEYFSASMQNSLESNKKYAEFVTNVVMTAASVAAFVAFLPAGVSVLLTRELAMKLVVMASLSASGAVGRPAILASIEGENFDSSPQALLMNGSLGALEMLLSYPFGMGVLTAKTSVALTAEQATERVGNVLGKIATLSGNPNDPALASVRAEAFEAIKALGNYSDEKQMTIWRDQILGALIQKEDQTAKDLVTIAAAITAATNEQVARQIPDLLTKINAIAPENSQALSNARVEAWNILGSKTGMSEDALAQTRKSVLQALEAKKDPVAIAAIKALESVESLSKVSGSELADRLKERIYQSIVSTEAGAAEAIKQVQRQADQTLANLIIQKIDTQALTLPGADLQALKAQALSALDSLSSLGNSPEIASLRNQLIEALAKAKDSGAQAALEVRNILNSQTNNSLDLATYNAFNQKYQQNPELLDQALGLLQKQKGEIEQLQAKLITDATTLPPNLTTEEISNRVLSATNQLNAISQPSPEVLQALRKQATDAIEVLRAQGADNTSLELEFYQALVRHDNSVAARVASLEQTAQHNATLKQVEDLIVSVQNSSGNRTELALLRTKALESLTKLGDTPEALAMRTRILTAFEQSQDDVAKIAVEAFTSIKGLNNEKTLAQEIMLAFSRGSERELQLIKLKAVKERISFTSENINSLRQQALSIIDKLPAEAKDLERMQLFRELQNKDSFSQFALQAYESLEGLGSDVRNRLIQEILTELERNNSKDIIKVRISALTEKILNASEDPSVLLNQALSTFSSLGNDAALARIEFLKAIETKIPSAKPARQALERTIGTENETATTSQILSALSSNDLEEIARIKVNTIIEGIARGGGNLNVARKDLLEAILELPNQKQQALRVRGLELLRDNGDDIARVALQLNDAFRQASANSLDLVSLAKLKLSLPADIDSALAAFGRNKSHFDALFSSVESASLARIENLDVRTLTENLASLTEQIAASAADKEIVAAIQAELIKSLQTLTLKIGDLAPGSFELAALRERAFASIEKLSGAAPKEEIEALKLSILEALATKNDSVATFTLSIKNYFDNASTLKAEDIAALENLDPSLRNEALTILGRTKEELDQIRLNSLTRLRSVQPDLSIEGVVDNLGRISESYANLPREASDALRDSLKQQMEDSVNIIANDIRTGSAAFLPEKRRQAFLLLENFSEKGFTESQEAELRSRILEALKSQKDPVATAAIAALDALRGLEKVVAEKRASEILVALAENNSQNLRQLQLLSLQDQIIAGSIDQTILRKQGLEAILALPFELQKERRLSFLASIANHDRIAETALSLERHFDNATSLTVEDLVLIEKLDPIYRNEALSALQRTKLEFDQIISDSFVRIGTVKPDLAVKEYLTSINTAIENLNRLSEISEPFKDALRKQISSSLEAIVSNTRNSTSFLGSSREEIFTLLNNLSSQSMQGIDAASIRSRLLGTLASNNDLNAQATLDALNAIRGLQNEDLIAKDIFSALATNNSDKIREIQIEALKSKILSGQGDINALRNDALEAVSLLTHGQNEARLNLLSAIAEKDRVANTAISITEFLKDSSNITLDTIVAIQKLDPELTAKALDLLKLNRQQLDDLISTSLSRLRQVNPEGTITQTIDVLKSSINDLERLTDISPILQETLRQRISASIEVLTRNIGNGSILTQPQRLEAFELLSKLSKQGFTEPEIAAFRTKILDSFVAANDTSAKLTVDALEAVRGLNNSVELTSQIYSAFARNSQIELRRIQINAFEERILQSQGDVNALRKQALEILEEFPAQDRLNFLRQIADKDPVAEATLTLDNYFKKPLDLTLEDVTALKSLKPEIEKEALNILKRSKEELDQIAAHTLLRLGKVKENQSFEEALRTIDEAIQTITQIDASLDPLKEPFRKQVIASVDAIVSEIRTGGEVISQEHRKRAFQLIDSLSENSFSEEQEAILRTQILNALEDKKDSTAIAALGAFEALKGADQQIIKGRTREILALLSQDNQENLVRTQISILQDTILAGRGDIQALRKSALDAISQLPETIQEEVRLNFLLKIQDKDPVAKAALVINSSFNDASKLTIDKVAELENLDPNLRTSALSIIKSSQQQFDQLISDSFTRLAAIEPDLTIPEALNRLILTYEEMTRIAVNSPGLRNAWKQRITSTIESIVKEIKGGSELIGDQRRRAFEFIEDLPAHGFTQSETNELRKNIVLALADKGDESALLAKSALIASEGLEDKTIISNIYAALIKDNIESLRRLEVSAIKAKILAGTGDVDALRSQALETISKITDTTTTDERIKFLSSISAKDPIAKMAVDLNELFLKKPDATFDLIAFAKFRLQLKGQNLDDALQAIGRSNTEFHELSTKFAQAYSESLKPLDVAELTQRIKLLTDQVVVSAKDREIATLLQQRLSEAVETLTRRMSDLPSTASNVALIKEQIDTALQTLRNHIGRIEYAKFESVLKQSLSKFDQSIAAELAAAKSASAIERMNASITQIKNFNGKDFVSIREQGLIALREMEGVVDGPTLIKARKDLLEALAQKQDRFAVNVLKRDALKDRIANGDFDALAALERDMKRSLESGVTNQEAINFLKAESDTIAELKVRITRMQSANQALETLTATSDQALIAAARKEATEALNAMKPHLNESTFTKLQTKLEQQFARFEKPVVPEVAPAATVKTTEIKAPEVNIMSAPQRLSELTDNIRNFKGNAKELTALRTEALKTMEEAENIVDAVTLNRMRKEVYEALAAQNDDFATKALKRIALREEAEKGKLNPLARLEDDITKEISRVQSLVLRLEKRKGAELELAAERRALAALLKEQAEAAALRKTIEARVIPVAVAATAARATARELYAPNPEEPVKEVPLNLVPSAALMDLARVRLGEGPWQSAERILASDGKPHTVAEVRALTRAIQATYLMDNGSSDMSGLPVNYYFVTPDNYGALINAVKDDNIKYILLGLAN